MEVHKGFALLQSLMTDHGLTALGWKPRLDNAVRRFGYCAPGTKTISLSRRLTKLNAEDEVKDTILHEIAHALAWIETGENCGHDARWRAICQRIGARPDRCFSEEQVTLPDATWVLAHKDTGEIFRSYHRRPSRNFSQIWIRGRKAETLGKLVVRSAQDTSPHKPKEDSPNNPEEETSPDNESQTPDQHTPNRFEEFNPSTCASLHQSVWNSLNKQCEEFGLEVAIAKISYTDIEADMSIKFSVIPQDGTSVEEQKFRRDCLVFGLRPEHYKTPIHHNGKIFSLVEFKPQNRKYPIIAVGPDKRLYKLPEKVIDHLRDPHND